MRLLIALVAVIAASAVGAMCSVSVRAGATGWLLMLPAILMMVAWRLAISVGAQMPVTVVTFDVMAGGTYLVVYCLLGDKISTVNIAGACVALAGVALMAWR